MAKQPAAASGTQELDKLIRDSEEAIKRLDDRLKGRSGLTLMQRAQKIWARSSGSLVNILLSGTCFFIALGRLDQKYTHQAEKVAWEAEKERLEKQGHAYASSTEALVAALEEAAEGRGKRDLPAIVQQQLAAWRERLSSQPAAAAADRDQQPPGDGGLGDGGGSSQNGGSGGGGGKLMI